MMLKLMYLVAKHEFHPEQLDKVEVNENDLVMIGRNPRHQAGEKLLLNGWPDLAVNRTHSRVHRVGSKLVLELSDPGKGTPFFRCPETDDARGLDRVELQAGDSVHIGKGGPTTLHCARDFAEAAAHASVSGAAGYTKSSETSLFYADADMDIKVLRAQLKSFQTELPSALAGWNTEKELFVKVAEWLQGYGLYISYLEFRVAFVSVNITPQAVEWICLNPHTSVQSDWRPSRTILRSASELSLKDPSVAKIWRRETRIPLSGGAEQPSNDHNIDWAVALPVRTRGRGEPFQVRHNGLPVFLYVEACGSSPRDGRQQLPMLGMTTQLVASLLEARERKLIQDRFGAYFSPAVRGVIEAQDEKNLEPTLQELTVLFCDRRGSSAQAESALQPDRALECLKMNNTILSKVVQTIFKHQGVITDYAGDGVLAFWGWPEAANGPHGVPFDHGKTAVEAARDILCELSEFRSEDRASQRKFAACRIGISTGRVAVGKIGPREQPKIGVFGTVVNFGARLEGLGKVFHIPVILSEETALRVRNHCLVRKLCWLRPSGFNQAYPIYELVLPQELGGTGATQAQVEAYEAGLAHFCRRDWAACRKALKECSESDESALWLENQNTHLKNNEPPPNWQGEVAALSK